MTEQILAVQRMQDYIEQHLNETSRWQSFRRYPCTPRGIPTGCLRSIPILLRQITSAVCGCPGPRFACGMRNAG